MRVKICLLIIMACEGSIVLGQQDSVRHHKPTFTISSFADGFYVYDFNKPEQKKRQSYLYNHNRHNELNLNLGFVKFGMVHTNYRANLALHAGTYSQDNYAAEPDVLKNIFEANVGISLNRKKNVWIDAGVFASHIGFESAISTDNWTMTRSLLAENSPYFLSGAKLTYNPNDQWQMAALVINGWQRIQKIKGNSLPSFGTQITFSPTTKATLNWSTFIGTDDPDNIRRMRFFNNFYGKFQLTKKLGLLAGFDIGTQQRMKSSSIYDIWCSPVLIGQYTIGKTWKAGMRVEYYQDEKGIIIATGQPNGFKTTGLSLNLDCMPNQHLVCRMEGRWLTSQDPIFETKTDLTSNNFILATSIAINFSKTIKKPHSNP